MHCLPLSPGVHNDVHPTGAGVGGHVGQRGPAGGTGQLGAAAGNVGVRLSQTLRKLGMNWAVVADSETCTSECMSDQLATLGRNRETNQLAPLGRNREMSAW